MRTVSFSNRKVQRTLNNEFVNTFTNTEGDPTAGMSISHRPNDQPGFCSRGNGKQNVQTIFLTPEGNVFHAATGFLSPEDLANEISFAAALFKELESKDDDEDLVIAAHRNRLAEAGFTESEIEDQSPLASMNMLAKQLGQNGPMNFASGNFGMNGSSSKNGSGFRGANTFGNPLAAFSRMQILDDNKFSIQNPMIEYEWLQRDPGKLVGRGKSFFASSSSSN